MCAAVPMVAAPQIIAASAFHPSVPAMRIAAVAASAIMSFRIRILLGLGPSPFAARRG
jgi:hypothetical protein